MISQRLFHTIVGCLGGGTVVAFAMATLSKLGGLS